MMMIYTSEILVVYLTNFCLFSGMWNWLNLRLGKRLLYYNFFVVVIIVEWFDKTTLFPSVWKYEIDEWTTPLTKQKVTIQFTYVLYVGGCLKFSSINHRLCETVLLLYYRKPLLLFLIDLFTFAT